MYKTTFAHRRAAKNGDNDWLSTKLHFFCLLQTISV